MYKIHTTKDKVWKTAKGVDVPLDWVKPLQKEKEKATAKLLKVATKISADLAEFKKTAMSTANEIYLKGLAEKGVDGADKKGNFTFFNFDESIKIIVSVSERIAFDDVLIEAAKSKFQSYLDANVTTKDAVVRTMIMQAFETSKGQLDTKRVLNLLTFESQVPKKDFPEFHEALECIKEAIRRPDSKKYIRFFTRQENGEYLMLNLDFASA